MPRCLICGHEHERAATPFPVTQTIQPGWYFCPYDPDGKAKFPGSFTLVAVWDNHLAYSFPDSTSTTVEYHPTW